MDRRDRVVRDFADLGAGEDGYNEDHEFYSYRMPIGCTAMRAVRSRHARRATMLAEQMLPRARERLVMISGSDLVKDAAALMAKPHTDIVVVCGSDGRIVGVLTKTDIVRQITRCTGNGCTASVDTIMTRDVASCQIGEPLHDIWSVMKARRLQRIPVIDQIGRPVGVIYARDTLQALLSEVESDETLLRDYVMNVGYQ
jgi:CBS domain-containing protein